MTLKNPKAIIVWDFDGVLFEANRYRLDNRRKFVELGVSEKKIISAVEHTLRNNGHFSIDAFARGLHAHKVFLSKRAIRRTFHHNLLTRCYYDPRVDKMLHGLKKLGFRQMVLSLGSAPFQYKKMFLGCGTSFRKHFTKIQVTTRPKFLTLLKTQRQNKGIPLFFVDDTPENLKLAKKHIHDIITIHYSNISGHSLNELKRKILYHAKTKK